MEQDTNPNTGLADARVIPIYQTMTGCLQCITVDGRLFLREWEESHQHSKERNPNPWQPAPDNFDIPYLVNAMEQARKANDDKTCRRLACMMHCLQDMRQSAYRMEPLSDQVARQIGELERVRERALKLEAEDRAGAVVPSQAKPNPFKGGAEPCVNCGESAVVCGLRENGDCCNRCDHRPAQEGK